MPTEQVDDVPRRLGRRVSELIGDELDGGSLVDQDARESVAAGVRCDATQLRRVGGI
jgi:hypothetical protein